MVEAQGYSEDETTDGADPSAALEIGVRGGRRYGGLTSSERRALRRRRLLDTGLELFGTTGYAPTTIEGICAASGVTARHFYEEFGSREELLKAVFDESVETTTRNILRTLEESPVDPDNLDDRVHSGVAAFVHSFLDDARRARVVCVEAIGVSPEMEAHRRTVIHGFAQILQSEAGRLAEQGVEWRGDFTLTTRALVGGTNELIVDWLLESPRPSLNTLTEVVSNLYLAVINYR